MSETELAAMARTYVNTGWSVFPIWWTLDDGRCACPEGARCSSPAKHPLVARGVHNASSELGQVAAWWQEWPQANIGLPADANGLAILDIDPRHDGLVSLARLVALLKARHWGSMPSTLTSITGSGGLHLVFAAPPGGIKNGSGVFGADMPGLDTRGRGGYVVAPPSRHRSGHSYTWMNFFHEVAPWPSILSGLIDPPKPGTATTLGATTKLGATTTLGAATTLGGPARDTAPGKDFASCAEPYVLAAVRDELARVEAAQVGSRNATLHVAAFRLGQLAASTEAGVVDVADIEARLVDAGVSTGLGLTETHGTVRSGLRAGIAHPRQAVTPWPI